MEDECFLPCNLPAALTDVALASGGRKLYGFLKDSSRAIGYELQEPFFDIWYDRLRIATAALEHGSVCASCKSKDMADCFAASAERIGFLSGGVTGGNGRIGDAGLGNLASEVLQETISRGCSVRVDNAS
mmetsp:Transcript_52937/g.84133  ORF Transcript_52937/g.84133 Transcript_52937/m.84133 type:complete len:130 (+) Transcript_52937:348-737(+)